MSFKALKVLLGFIFLISYQIGFSLSASDAVLSCVFANPQNTISLQTKTIQLNQDDKITSVLNSIYADEPDQTVATTGDNSAPIFVKIADTINSLTEKINIEIGLYTDQIMIYAQNEESLIEISLETNQDNGNQLVASSEGHEYLATFVYLYENETFRAKAKCAYTLL